MKKSLLLLLRIIGYICIMLEVISAVTMLWLMKTWTQLSYAELIFHLKSSITGTNKDMVIKAVCEYALPAIVFLIIVICINELIIKKYKINIFVPVIIIVLLLVDFGVGKKFDNRTNIISDLLNTLLRTNESDFVENNYVETGNVKIEFPNNKRNLIYIYLESTEISCADIDSGGAFEENVIPNLTKLAEENEDFSGSSSKLLNGAVSLPGTDWTMGAMFAQSTGLPLKIALGGNTFGEGTSTSFFPQITSIGDILEDNGYKNVLLLGSDANFGGRKLFYKTHGNYDIHDFYYAKEKEWISKDYYCFWGFEDYKLFDFAKKDIQELAKDNKPFNYTMLTVDTHFEDGYYCDYCREDFGDNQYANVFACADRQVADFIEWLKRQDFYENTTIVVCGDHTTMDSDFYEDIDENYQRRTYTCIINGCAEKEIDDYRKFATIDLFPTTLAAMGAEISSDRLGIGTNLYSDGETLIEQYGVNKCNEELKKTCPFLEDMSGIQLDENMFDNAREKVVFETADEGGLIRFRLHKLSNYIKEDTLDGIVVDIVNGKTKEEKLYTMDIVEYETSDGYYGVIHSDIPFSDLPYIDCKVYINAGEYKNYLFKEYTPDLFEAWDVRWDE